ncbi:MAG: sigma-70 family RNA polymerase sigma factor [candidate division WOR-3 bacterium]
MVNEKMDEDLNLIRRFKNGDETCFDELVKKYQNKIYNLAYRMVHNSEDAWDLAQETFVQAYNGLSKFKQKSTFYTWLYRICVNRCLNFNQRKTRSRTINNETISEVILMNTPARNTPETDFRQGELKIAITSAVKQLPDKQRAVFLLRQYEGLRIGEIAKIMGCSKGTVKAHYFHAVQKLRELLKPWV